MDPTTALTQQHFIPTDMRPRVIPDFSIYPAHAPDLSKEALKTRTLEILGLSEEEWRMANPPIDQAEVWTQEFIPSPDTIGTPMEDDYILLHLQTNCYHTLNRVGAFIWRLFERGRNLEEIIQALLERYEASESVMRHDLLALTVQLQTKELIVRNSE